MTTPFRYVLGSRSPRRFELLQHLVPVERIDVVPPASVEELGFDGLTTWPDIRARLLDITRGKSEQVCRQLTAALRGSAMVITADTTIVVSQGPTRRSPSASGEECALTPPLCVLGQPPEGEDWAVVVRDWFRTRYAGRTHVAATALRVVFPDGRATERVVTTAVTFRADVDRWLDWYFATGEPRGKAGGYALQGAGSVFVERVEGSLSNVVGLPLEALAEMLSVSAAR
jgi:septum formation protein